MDFIMNFQKEYYIIAIDKFQQLNILEYIWVIKHTRALFTLQTELSKYLIFNKLILYIIMNAGDGQLQEKAQKLFKTIVTQEQLNLLATINNKKQFLGLCSMVGTLFYRKVKKKPNQILAFLANYHQIIMNINLPEKDVNQQAGLSNAGFVNNVSLHFILLASYNSLETGNQLEAKQLLKSSINYIDSTDPDPILLATALSNLSLIMMKRGKHFKPLPYLLKTIEILQTKIKHIKKSSLIEEQKKQQILQIMIFLLNGYLNLSKCLEKIIRKNNKEIYRNMLKEVNRIALKKSLKYLGKSSFFTVKLVNQIQSQTANNIYHFSLPLPVFKSQVEPSSEEEPEEERDHKIMMQFQKLYTLIRQIQQKQVVVVSQPVKTEPDPPKPPPVVNSSVDQIVCKLNFKINGWDIEVQILKDKKDKKKKQRLGTILLNCYRNKQHISAMIPQKKMLKIMSQMNIYDILPYQIDFLQMTSQQLIQYCVIAFLSIDDNKNLQLYPRVLGFLNPISYNFMQKKCYIFTNHIKNNNYRLAICAVDDCRTYHLDIEFESEFIDEIVELVQKVDGSIAKVYEQLSKYNSHRQASSTTRFRPELVGQPKQLNIKNEEKLIKMISRILKQFQIFLIEKKNQEELETLKKQYEYYKFMQSSRGEGEGRFYYIRFAEETDVMEVFVQNTFLSFGMEGKYKSKGNASISVAQLAIDFGFIESNLRLMLKQTPYLPFKMLASLLSKKFDLKFYETPLTETNKQTFQQNSVIELKLTERTFLRKMVRYKDYTHPLTIALININNEFPIGLKISLYDQIICQEAGYFIHIISDDWKWPVEANPRKNQYQDILYNVVEQYKYKKNYFLVEWLERIGYRKIFEMIKFSKDGDFEIPELNKTFDRISSVLRAIYP